MLSLNNDTHILDISQQNYLNSTEVPQFIASAETIFPLSSQLKHFTSGKLMSFLLHCANKNKQIQISQRTVAEHLGVNIRTARRIMSLLRDQSFFSVDFHYRKVNTYTLNDLWYNPTVRIALQHLFPQINDLKKAKQQYYANIVCENNVYSLHVNQKKVSQIKKFTYIEYASEDGYEKMPSYIKGNIFRENTECDDGVLLSDNQAEPDWLVAAGQPIGYDSVVFKNNKENQKQRDSVTTTKSSCPPSPHIFMKKNSSPTDLKKGIAVEENLYEQVLPISQELKAIRPTKWGQIKLSAFSDEAILYADAALLKTSGVVSDKFKYFVKICKSYSDQQKLSINWSVMISLGAKYQMQDNHIWIDESFVPKKQQHKETTKQKYATNGTSPKSVGMQEAIASNKALIAEYAVHLLERDTKKQTVEEELAELKTTDPERYTFRVKYAQDLLVACGRDPITGDAMPKFDPLKAVSVLLGTQTLPPMEKISIETIQPLPIIEPIQFIRTINRELFKQQFDEYDGYNPGADPFGDRN